MTTTDNTIPPEPWVDCAAVGRHLGFSDDHVRKMASRGELPGKLFQNGKRSFWRFRISDVDASLTDFKPDLIRHNVTIMSPIGGMAGV